MSDPDKLERLEARLNEALTKAHRLETSNARMKERLQLLGESVEEEEGAWCDICEDEVVSAPGDTCERCLSSFEKGKQHLSELEDEDEEAHDEDDEDEDEDDSTYCIECGDEIPSSQESDYCDSCSADAEDEDEEDEGEDDEEDSEDAEPGISLRDGTFAERLDRLEDKFIEYETKAEKRLEKAEKLVQALREDSAFLEEAMNALGDLREDMEEEEIDELSEDSE